MVPTQMAGTPKEYSVPVEPLPTAAASSLITDAGRGPDQAGADPTFEACRLIQVWPDKNLTAAQPYRALPT